MKELAQPRPRISYNFGYSTVEFGITTAKSVFCMCDPRLKYFECALRRRIVLLFLIDSCFYNKIIYTRFLNSNDVICDTRFFLYKKVVYKKVGLQRPKK